MAQITTDGAWGWISISERDLDTLRSLLGRFPEAGRELDRIGRKTLRRLKLHRAPFFVWYSFDPGRREGVVELYRLFHSRQQTPEARLLLNEPPLL